MVLNNFVVVVGNRFYCNFSISKTCFLANRANLKDNITTAKVFAIAISISFDNRVIFVIYLIGIAFSIYNSKFLFAIPCVLECYDFFFVYISPLYYGKIL